MNPQAAAKVIQKLFEKKPRGNAKKDQTKVEVQ
jgi:hypothetical protein